MATIKRGNPEAEKIKYIKGTYFAVRPDSDKELFWLAISLEDVSNKNKEVYVRWLNSSPDNELEYKIGPEAQSSKIPVESIIVTTILKNNTKEPNVFKISKKELVRVRGISQNESSEEEITDDEASGEEEEEEEESEEEEEKMKVDKKKKTTTTTATKKTPVKKETKTPVKKTPTKKTPTKKTPTKKTPSKSKKSKKSDVEESQSESEESEQEESESESEEEVKSSKKKKTSTPKKSIKKETPKKKKTTKKSKSKKEESESEESESESEQESEEEESADEKKSKKKATSSKKKTKASKSDSEKTDKSDSEKAKSTKKTLKKRKLEEESSAESGSEPESGVQEIKDISTGKPVKKKSKGKDGEKQKAPKTPKKEPKAKKAPKESTKKGTPNSSIPMIETDPTWESTSNDFEFCCSFCIVREATRAVLTNNMVLLEAIVNRSDFFTLTCKPNSNSKLSPLEYAIQNNNLKALELILTDFKNEKKVRAELPKFHEASTGSYSRYTYGHHIRAITQSRGGKEGDEAFHHDRESYNADPDDDHIDELAQFICKTPGITLATIQLLSKYFTDLDDSINDNVSVALRAGNLDLSSHIIKKLFEREGFGYNILHVQALSTTGVDFEAFKSVSVTKKPNSGSISPIHHAAINPNGKYLKALLDVLPQEANRPDHNQFKPIHYAAACSSPVNITYLLTRNVDLNDLALHNGLTALNVACLYGRVANVKYLLKVAKDRNGLAEFVNFKNKKSQQAIHFASINGNTAIIRMLIEAGAETNVQEKATRDTPLMKAVINGHFDAAKMLVEIGKADIEKKDKYKATALTRAIVNGELIIASYLLHMNASVKAVDSSKNTLLHYSCAYGWFEITKYLIEKFNLSVNDFNDWKSTPLSLAIKKAHLRISKYLMDKSADANVCDENGRSLLLQTLSSSISESNLPTIDFLISKSKASVNHVDKDGNGPFHYIALAVNQQLFNLHRQSSYGYGYNRYNKNNQTEKTTEEIEAFKKLIHAEVDMLKKVGKLLLDAGADLNLANKKGVTPLMQSFDSKSTNVPMIMYLLNNNASISGQYPEDGSNILHSNLFALVKNYSHVFEELVKPIITSKDLSTLINQYNSNGFTPVISMMMQYKSNITTAALDPLFQNLFQALLIKGKADVSLVENKTLYVKPTHGDNVENKEDEDEDMDEDDGTDEDMDDSDGDGSDEDSEDDHSAKPKRSSAPSGSGDSHSATEKEKSLQRSTLHFAVETQVPSIVKKIIDMKPKTLDPVDSSKNTPLHTSINRGDFQIAILLVDSGSNAKLSDEHNNTPLHLACKKMNFPLIKKLILKNSPVNQKNESGLTPLMLACIHKENISDGSLEGEDNPISLLLKNGADAKLLDHKDRTALHFSVNASTGDSNSSFEVEDLLIKHQSPLNAVDQLGRTPLHYCFIKMGMNNITNGKSTDPIQFVSSICSFKDVKVDIADKFGRSPLFYAAQHGSTVSALHLLQRGANINRLDEDGNSPLCFSLIYSHPDCAISLIQKNADVKNLLTKYDIAQEKVEINPTTTTTADAKQNGNGSPVLKPVAAEKKYKTIIVKKNIKKVGLFYHVVSNNWQGVAYIMLDAGLDSFSALHDAFKADKYQLALTLLSKIRDIKELGVLSPKNRNLFHFIGKFPSTVSNWSTRVQQKLLDAKLSPNIVDKVGKTPLHFAVESPNNVNFVTFLLSNKLDINAKDKKGNSPFSIALVKITNSTDKPTDMVKRLIARADINATFTFGDSKITPLIYAIKIKNIQLIKDLLEAKVNINTPDVDGLTPIMHAVRSNSMEITQLLLEKKPNLSLVDQERKSVIHHIVNPTEFGSYENVNLLNLVAKSGAPIDLADIGNHTPNYYASLQDDGKLSEVLVSLGAKKVNPSSLPARETSVISNWNQINFEEEFDKFMAKHNEEISGREPLKPKVDSHSGLSHNSEVYIDDNGVIYDVMLTKVDAAKGKWGMNNFYALQIIYNKQQDVYFLFNRYGRIGESGQYQKTPYSKEEVVVEFQKIFKSKTGNTLTAQSPVGFNRVEGKYNMIKIDRTDRSRKKLLHPFKFDQYPASKLPKEIQYVMKQFCDVELIEAQLSSLHFNSNIMPLGRISKEIISSAVAILGKLKELLDTLEEKLKDPLTSTGGGIVKLNNEIGEEQIKLSNEFYELIPHSDFATDKMDIINDTKTINVKLEQLRNLDELALVSKILIAAHQNTKLHPFDYCYSAMGATLESIDKESPEFQAIKTYATNTGCESSKITGIFKLQRRGEAERFQVHRNLKNHFLLWHGSRTTNYLSILSQGLKKDEPTAPVTGKMFGRGIYLASMFSKSINYCGFGQSSKYLLLSEVALGVMAQLRDALYLESPMPGTNSTKGIGKRSPDFNDSIILNNGVTIPLGKPIDNNSHDVNLAMDEYVVYENSQIRMRYLVQVSN